MTIGDKLRELVKSIKWDKAGLPPEMQICCQVALIMHLMQFEFANIKYTQRATCNQQPANQQRATNHTTPCCIDLRICAELVLNFASSFAINYEIRTDNRAYA